MEKTFTGLFFAILLGFDGVAAGLLLTHPLPLSKLRSSARGLAA